MAASTSVTAAGSTLVAPSLRDASMLSSGAAFGSHAVHFAPVRSSSCLKAMRIVNARASQLSEGQRTARREMLGLMAAGAVLASTGREAFAASGPGIDGAKRTSEKAADLLKNADGINLNDAPERFGPGRVGEAAGDASKIAQQSGSGAVKELQGSADSAVETAKANVNEASRRVQELFGKDKVSDVSDASGVNVDEAKQGAKNVVDSAQTNASSVGDSAKNIFGDAADKANQTVGEVQNKADNSGDNAKSLFGSLQDGFQDLKNTVTSKAEEAKGIAKDATSK